MLLSSIPICMDHPSGNYHDDICNSVAGVASLAVSFINKGPVAQFGTFRSLSFDMGGDGGRKRFYKLGKYGQRVEVIPDWAERGERFAPGDPRLELETHDIEHSHNYMKQDG
jgi:hypothetical protein